MQNNYFLVLLLLLVLKAFPQGNDSDFKSEELKRKYPGKFIGSTENLKAEKSFKVSNSSPLSSTSLCNCWLPRDPTWQVAPMNGSGGSGGPGLPPDYRNDDWSTASIPLPFTFCLYGTQYNSVFINNNGNISFGAAYSTFSAVSFPSNQYVMVAPFWGDVDTQGPTSGLVYYKLTPTALLIQWDSVGYFSSHTDKLNEFQLIITDGNDPILPNGNNISFCYKDMQWTTGDASGGQGGFGGTPATVGINKGDGVNYIQLGLFDQAGSAYDGPGLTTDGVDWLDNQGFFFNSCGSSTNLPPLFTNLNACGDTITICDPNDTLIYTLSFQAPELNQVTSATASAPSLGSNFSVLGTNQGNSGSITFQIIASALLTGSHTISVTATDNGSPALSTTVSFIVDIVNSNVSQANISISPSPPCINQNPVITLNNCNSFASVTWDNTSSGCTYSPIVPGSHYVTISDTNGCYKTLFATIFPNPQVQISGSLSFCPPSTGTELYANVSGGTANYFYNWDSGVSSNDTLFIAGNGTHTVVVTDSVGCTASSSVNVNGTVAPSLNIFSVGNLCIGPVTLQTTIPNASSYFWQPGGQSTSTIATSTPGTYSVSLVINGCSVDTSFVLLPPILPVLTLSGNPDFCPGDTAILSINASPSGNYTYNWLQSGNLIASGDTASFANTGAYAVVAQDQSTQCKDTLFFTVNQLQNPLAQVSGNTTVCAGASLTVSANPSGGTPPYSYLWMPGSQTSSSVNANNAITYTLTVTDANGCEDTTLHIIKLSNPFVYAADVNYCVGQSGSAIAVGSGTPPVTYTWLPGNVSGSVYPNIQPGTYTVSFTDTYGCSSSDVIVVNQNPLPVANFTTTPELPVEEDQIITFINQSTVVNGTIFSSSWDFGDLQGAVAFQPAHIYADAGFYSVTLIVISNKGCTDTLTKIIEILPSIIAPNIITPNGDGINETLLFKNLEYYPNSSLFIYNRWGKLIYSDTNYQNNWKGDAFNDGTYYYILLVKQTGKEFNGFFQIAR